MEILKKEVQEKDRAIGNQRAKPIYDVKRPVDLQGRQLPIPLQKIHACVMHARKWNLPLKTIYLCPSWYETLDSWTRRRATEQEADLKWELLTWDGVEIEIMPSNHVIRQQYGSDEIDWIYYERKNES